MFLKPSEIFYSQDSVASKFQDGRDLNQTAQMLLLKELDPEDLPVIQVVRRIDGKYYTLDNRRLYVFRVGQYNGVTAKVPIQLVVEQLYHRRKFTTKNGGTSITVRCGVTRCNWKASWTNSTVPLTGTSFVTQDYYLSESQRRIGNGSSGGNHNFQSTGLNVSQGLRRVDPIHVGRPLLDESRTAYDEQYDRLSGILNGLRIRREGYG